MSHLVTLLYRSVTPCTAPDLTQDPMREGWEERAGGGEHKERTLGGGEKEKPEIRLANAHPRVIQVVMYQCRCHKLTLAITECPAVDLVPGGHASGFARSLTLDEILAPCDCQCANRRFLGTPLTGEATSRSLR